MSKKEEIAKRIEELKWNIGKVKVLKKKKGDFVGDLIGRYESGDIDSKTYKQLLKDGLDGKKLSEWSGYYDKSVEVYQKHLDYYERKKGFVISVNKKFVLPILILLLIMASYFIIFSQINDVERTDEGTILLAPADLIVESCDNLLSWNTEVGWWVGGWTYQTENYCKADGNDCTSVPCPNGKRMNQTITNVAQYAHLSLSQFAALSNVPSGEGLDIYVDNGINTVLVVSFDGNGKPQQLVAGTNDKYPLDGLIDWAVNDKITIIYSCRADTSDPTRFCILDNINLLGEIADTMPPVVTIQEPVQGKIYSNNEANPLDFSVTVIDDIDPPANLVVAYSLDGGINKYLMSNTVGDTFTAQNTSIATGSYTFQVYAQDSSGNLNNNVFADFSVNNTLISGCGAAIRDSTEGTLYFLENDIMGATDSCIDVQVDWTFLNGNGFFIRGTGVGTGIDINKSVVRDFYLSNINVSFFQNSVASSRGGFNDDGTNIVINNSSIEQVVSYGEDGVGLSGKQGGNVFLYNSNLTGNIDVHGGSSSTFEGSPGDGGNIYIENKWINLSNVHLNLKSGYNTLAYGIPGRLTINYTAGFEDKGNNVYGSNLRLTLINGSANGGEIKWTNPLSLNVLAFKNLAENSRVAHNYGYVNSQGGGRDVLNSPAEISFYGMAGNFLNPKIWKDGLDCGVDCTIIDPLNTVGTVRFGVSGFSEYRIGDEIINSAPTIQNIVIDPDQTINTKNINGGVKIVAFTIVVSDPDGYGDINLVESSLFPPTDPVRNALSCIIGTIIDPLTVEFDCSVILMYYDEPGLWDVVARATDSFGNQDTKIDNNKFTLWQTDYVNFPNIAWSSLTPGEIDILADGGGQLLDNWGNGNYSSISITGKPLDGSSAQITSDKFSVSVNPVCSEFRLVDEIPVVIPNGVLLRGDNSQEVLNYCAEEVPIGLPPGSYTASGPNGWEIVFAFIFGFLSMFALPLSIKRRKELLKLAKSLSKDELLVLLGDKLALESDVKSEKVLIPSSIFKEKKIGPAEVLCKYLKENEEMKFSEIAKLIGRDQRTIWNNYNNSLKKKRGKIVVVESKMIPIDVFDKRLSILEAVVYYLRRNGLSNLEVAKIIGKDNRNIWTLHSRAKKKLE